ncbi:MAG: hypothetical protein MJ252_29470, partial [archaeon]|nr:hypothetical protein [archaeon]
PLSKEVFSKLKNKLSKAKENFKKIRVMGIEWLRRVDPEKEPLDRREHIKESLYKFRKVSQNDVDIYVETNKNILELMSIIYNSYEKKYEKTKDPMLIENILSNVLNFVSPNNLFKDPVNFFKDSYVVQFPLFSLKKYPKKETEIIIENKNIDNTVNFEWLNPVKESLQLNSPLKYFICTHRKDLLIAVSTGELINAKWTESYEPNVMNHYTVKGEPLKFDYEGYENCPCSINCLTELPNGYFVAGANVPYVFILKYLYDSETYESIQRINLFDHSFIKDGGASNVKTIKIQPISVNQFIILITTTVNGQRRKTYFLFYELSPNEEKFECTYSKETFLETITFLYSPLNKLVSLIPKGQIFIQDVNIFGKDKLPNKGNIFNFNQRYKDQKKTVIPYHEYATDELYELSLGKYLIGGNGIISYVDIEKQELLKEFVDDTGNSDPEKDFYNCFYALNENMVLSAGGDCVPLTNFASKKGYFKFFLFDMEGKRLKKPAMKITYENREKYMHQHSILRMMYLQDPNAIGAISYGNDKSLILWRINTTYNIEEGDKEYLEDEKEK